MEGKTLGTGQFSLFLSLPNAGPVEKQPVFFRRDTERFIGIHRLEAPVRRWRHGRRRTDQCSRMIDGPGKIVGHRAGERLLEIRA
jgi:hypothetical protein